MSTTLPKTVDSNAELPDKDRIDWGNRLRAALKHLRGTDPNQKRCLFICLGNATGDLPHVVPVLLSQKAHYRILVVDGLPGPNATEPTQGKPKLVDVMTRIYGVGQDQVARVSAEKTRKVWTGEGKARTSTDVTVPQQAQGLLNEAKTEATKLGFFRIYQLADSTKILRAEYFGDTEVVFSGEEKIKETGEIIIGFETNGRSRPSLSSFGVPRLSEVRNILYGKLGEQLNLEVPLADFAAILKDAGVTPDDFKKPLVVLWGRSSKQRDEGGIHYDLNHSNFAWAQLTGACIQRGWSVFLVGDVLKAKWESLQQEGFKGSRFIGPFYTRGTGLSRPMQLHFFDYLERQLGTFGGNKYLHVGMRSGGLDMYGFAGQPVLYVATEKLLDTGLQEKRLTGDERMSAVTGALQGKQGVSYNRFIAEREPKRWTHVGDDEMPDAERKAKGPGKLSAEEKAKLPPEVRHAGKGFTEKDLEALITRIKGLLVP